VGEWRSIFAQIAGRVQVRTLSLSADVVDRLRKMLAFLDAMENPEELRSLPLWKAQCSDR
jgi:hypothetical protein